jgi:hypothetical protein
LQLLKSLLLEKADGLPVSVGANLLKFVFSSVRDEAFDDFCPYATQLVFTVDAQQRQLNQILVIMTLEGAAAYDLVKASHNNYAIKAFVCHI